jgi:hypothetical protein
MQSGKKPPKQDRAYQRTQKQLTLSWACVHRPAGWRCAACTRCWLFRQSTIKLNWEAKWVFWTHPLLIIYAMNDDLGGGASRWHG